MLENRYGDKLREGNQLILNLTPANYVLRIELSFELKKLIKNQIKFKILEIGSGEGDLTKYILKNNKDLHIDCLDISKEMVDLSKKYLSDYISRINFINEDALEFLNNLDLKYNIIVSAWTIHNFTWEEKKSLFNKIYSSLSKGGTFLLMDKVYPDNEKEKINLLDTQVKRYSHLNKGLNEEIINHEKQDFLDDYRMDEYNLIKILKQIGFKEINILDRVERDILLIAKK